VAENKEAPDSNIGVPPTYAKNFLAAFVKNFLTACSAAAAHFPALPADNAALGLNNSDILLSLIQQFLNILGERKDFPCKNCLKHFLNCTEEAV
jgi:hypothetical protein